MNAPHNRNPWQAKPEGPVCPPHTGCAPVDVARWLSGSGVIAGAIQEGEMIPDFALPDAFGREVNVQVLLDVGPLVITFTLGARSFHCCRALAGLQGVLFRINVCGGSVIVITPDAACVSRELIGRINLAFSLLDDGDGRLAKLFGIAYHPPVDLSRWLPLLAVEADGGFGSGRVPLPATYVVGSDGIARFACLPADPADRAEPDAVAACVEGLAPSRPA